MQNFKLWAILIGMILTLVAPVWAADPVHKSNLSTFQKIDQPLFLKISVSLAGLSLIGLELNWFLNKKIARR